MPNRITMTDVAHAAGVSLMTVSRVVNEKEDVSSETRQRVLDVIHKLGYRPSSIARGLATRRTGTLGLVVPDIDNPFFSGIVRGAENQAYAEGYSVFLCNTNEDPQRELAVLQSLEDHFIDGLMLCSSRLEPDTLREAVSHFPTVVLVSRQIDEACTGTLLIDDEMGGRLAAEHLLQAGHTKIGFISGPQVSHSGKWRLKGYCSALQDSGIGIKDGWITYCAPVVEEGRRATLKLLENYPELTAVICHNDLVAVGAIHACSELSRILPNQLALIGFDDIPMASVVTPALTTCRVPREELGTQAMGLLLRQIEDCQDRDIKNILIRPELIVRASAP
jgi:LacI family transcriptional regulator